MRGISTFFGGLLSLALLISPASADKIELKFAHDGHPGSLFDLCVVEYAKRANEKLGETAQVTTFGSSQLGDDTAVMQKVKLGQVAIALPTTVMSSVSDKFGVFEMPYLIRDRAHMIKVREKVLDSVFKPAAKEKGYRILAVWENGFRHITNNLRPIKTPEDLKGLKLRVPKGVWRVKMFKAYGANPTPMGFSEVFLALQSGVIDGQENPYAQIASAKLQEVQKYLTVSSHVYTPAYLVVSEEHFQKLSPEIQKVLEETGVGMQDWVYETAAKLDQELYGKLKEKLEVNEADRAAFVAASGPIYKEFSDTVPGGAELVQTIQSLAK